jgi:L,D-transpeptidase YcbB
LTARRASALAIASLCRYCQATKVVRSWALAIGWAGIAVGSAIPALALDRVESRAVADDLRAACERAEHPGLRWPHWDELRQPVADFYARRDARPAWTTPSGVPTPQALAIVSLLEGAETRGLRTEDYDGLRWPRRIVRLQRAPHPAEIVEFDLALTVNLLRLARDLHGGRVDPRRAGLPLDWQPKPLDLAALAERLVAAPDPAARVEALEPQFGGYRRLKHALTRYLEMSRERDVTPLPAAEVVRPGDRYLGTPVLAELLERLGDLPAETLLPTDPTLYEGALVDAVRAFQIRHGLAADGKVGPLTFAELRMPLSARAEQIRLSLERWRWVPVAVERPPIVVNIPEFHLRAFDAEGRIGFSSRVVVGRAFRTETPVFADRLRTVVFRPSWGVPVSITRNEIVPRLERDAAYLESENFEIVGTSAQAVTPETLTALRRGSLLLRQRPGPGNALGLVKFVFPNEHSVYLHDTPARGGFARARRDLSHGCIRVEDAAGLAAWVLRENPEWGAEAIRAAMQSGRDEHAVTVAPPIPVYLVYVTAAVPEGEEPRFLADLYGHDARLAAALAARYPALRRD